MTAEDIIQLIRDKALKNFEWSLNFPPGSDIKKLYDYSHRALSSMADEIENKLREEQNMDKDKWKTMKVGDVLIYKRWWCWGQSEEEITVIHVRPIDECHSEIHCSNGIVFDIKNGEKYAEVSDAYEGESVKLKEQ